MEVQIELRIEGLWHMEDVFGPTMTDAAQLLEDERYRVREMPELMREIDEYWADDSVRRAMRQAWRHGMNVEAHAQRLPSIIELQTRGREMQWRDAADVKYEEEAARAEVKARQDEPGGQGPECARRQHERAQRRAEEAQRGTMPEDIK
jgi:hypothetical protein